MKRLIGILTAVALAACAPAWAGPMQMQHQSVSTSIHVSGGSSASTSFGTMSTMTPSVSYPTTPSPYVQYGPPNPFLGPTHSTTSVSPTYPYSPYYSPYGYGYGGYYGYGTGYYGYGTGGLAPVTGGTPAGYGMATGTDGSTTRVLGEQPVQPVVMEPLQEFVGKVVALSADSLTIRTGTLGNVTLRGGHTPSRLAVGDLVAVWGRLHGSWTQIDRVNVPH